MQQEWSFANITCVAWHGEESFIAPAQLANFTVELKSGRLARRVGSFGDIDDVWWLRQPEPGGTTGECGK
jgi:hypothetical protein